MAAAHNSVILGWKVSCMNIATSRPTQFSSHPSTRAAINTKLRCRSATTEEAAAGNTDIFSVTPSTAADFDYLGESTKGDLNLNSAINGEAGLDGPIEDVAKMEAQEAEHLLNHLGIPGNQEANEERWLESGRKGATRKVKAEEERLEELRMRVVS
ncbi:hypothetical protein SASPL_109393 [Salvia splendens]|uniref:Uncharacterized protein n=1 Tax=Salvia splendens TaxID=180675 RepID=A0A8X8YGF6_SALSN|nr:hypothetical protein SASPL_109393 [Salvia splendens]